LLYLFFVFLIKLTVELKRLDKEVLYAG